jgi:hypothetical protein
VIGYINDIHDLSSVLCIDPTKVIGHIHPSLANSSDVPSKSISDNTLDGLKMALQDLQIERKTRMKKVCKTSILGKNLQTPSVFLSSLDAPKILLFPDSSPVKPSDKEKGNEYEHIYLVK